MNKTSFFQKPEDLNSLSGTTGNGFQTKYLLPNGRWIKVDFIGHEGLSEDLASKFLECTDITDFISYKSIKLQDGRVGCICDSIFKNKDEIFITFKKLITQTGLEPSEIFKVGTPSENLSRLINIIKKEYFIDTTEYINRNLMLDYIILNPDRHLNNLGLIRNIKDGTFRVAPIFDNGYGFFPSGEDIQIGRMVKKLKFKPFGNSQLDFKSIKKLKVSKDKFDSLIKDYTNELYNLRQISKCKNILLLRTSSEVVEWI